ncbi:MAG: CBS domain-containing protein [Anaerolineae bacterium]|nr:CBS domain-containing protein [Anaerolineae bacterium]MCX8068196.1 CBS domain-containing protein [Anaerolineae bacterium]MDW7991647.1 CBS domain-containing protein [Anaerolineae bacterium]
MDLILTHENADFDAIASLLAAHRLFPDATPVLPRRINRNVRSFLSLYGAVLPFVHPDDLPRRSVGRVILVDTQALTTVKGMRPDTPVSIIDHHPLSRELRPGWTYQGEPVGATTTLLVEEIARRGLTLSPVEATLLLLGIYEDTGNLSYMTTTARDARAAAWLLEQGANLSLVGEFLHYPLAPAQQKLYEQLLESVSTHRIGGHAIVVASARAGRDYEEEISTLAHKLRDLLEPSALFVLVGLNRHVQMVARSSTDDIDVAAVAAHFGGGGHARAAAALVRDRTLEAVRKELLELLPRVVRPAATVRQIMSRGMPQVVSPDTTIAEAAERMRRVGHEGFPVVENGLVVGLLTRRAVDRAMQFGMAAEAVRQIMEPGTVTISPDDSVESLQRLMMETGWGQVPVVEEGEIIGIVTRTDLLNLWGGRQPVSRREEVQALLERALPPQTLALVRKAAEMAAQMGYSLYLVGGPVRDLLLGLPVVDLDLVVEGDAVRLARALSQQYGGRIVAHTRFGTAKWLLDPRVWEQVAGGPPPADRVIPTVDFATARTEFYVYPTALPEVERSSIKQDLHRRDFTINTLAIRLDPPHWGELLDFYGGEEDLREGVIRVLHSLSFIDDPTRILRAARLEARLNFRMDPRTEALIPNALPMLNRVSGERIRHELELILAEDAPERALCRLERLGVLRQIHPALACDRWLALRFQMARKRLRLETWGLKEGDRRLVYWGLMVYRLEEKAIREITARLRFSRSETDDLALIPELRKALLGVAQARRPSEIYRLLEPYPTFLLAVAWVAETDRKARSRLLRYQTVYRRVAPLLTGEDLKAMGLKPGPLFGELLRALRDARLDGRVRTREEEEALVRRIAGSDPELQARQ